MKRGAAVLVLMMISTGLLAVETTVKGGHMELLDKGEKILFRDGVKLTRGTDVVTAKEMLTTKERDKVTATGNVKLFRTVSSTENWKGTGSEGFYNTRTGDGYLVKKKNKAELMRTEVISSTVTRHMNVFADRIDFAKESSKAVATGRVYGKTVDPDTNNLYEFWSDRAHYDGSGKKIILSGDSPSRVRETGERGIRNITGNVITYFMDTKKFISDGDAMAVFIDKGKLQ
jgi:lipopolysaccharide export system protein LptA